MITYQNLLIIIYNNIIINKNNMNQVLESSLKRLSSIQENLLIGHSMIYSMPTKTVTKIQNQLKISQF